MPRGRVAYKQYSLYCIGLQAVQQAGGNPPPLHAAGRKAGGVTPSPPPPPSTPPGESLGGLPGYPANDPPACHNFW